MLRPDEFDAPLTKRQLDDAGLKGNLLARLAPRGTHADAPERARDFLRRALDQVAAIGTDFLGGVLYAHLGP